MSQSSRRLPGKAGNRRRDELDRLDRGLLAVQTRDLDQFGALGWLVETILSDAPLNRIPTDTGIILIRLLRHDHVLGTTGRVGNIFAKQKSVWPPLAHIGLRDTGLAVKSFGQRLPAADRVVAILAAIISSKPVLSADEGEIRLGVGAGRISVAGTLAALDVIPWPRCSD